MNLAQNFSHKQFAFTLAEVLITLGIIGIIAALTIPGLINSYNNHITETRLKRFYSIFNQALRLSVAENGDFEGWGSYWEASVQDDNDHVDYIGGIFEKYIVSYMKNVRTEDINGHRLYVLADGSAFSHAGNYLRDIYFYPKNPEKCIKSSLKAGEMCRFFFVFYPLSNVGSWRWHYKKGLETYMFGWDGDKEHLYSGLTYSCYQSGKMCSTIIKMNGWKIPKDFPMKIRY